ncbi:hypothetical protein N7523_002144 [Penicillium sp. IBT 18751x]|nr:hypothetical protein N7523_002144 [Penicillium sp. IBT 18751x]
MHSGVLNLCCARSHTQGYAHFDQPRRRLKNQSPCKLILQLYVPIDRTKTKSLTRRVKASGYYSLRKTPSTMASEKRQEMLRPNMTSGRHLEAGPFLDTLILD